MARLEHLRRDVYARTSASSSVIWGSCTVSTSSSIPSIASSSSTLHARRSGSASTFGGVSCHASSHASSAAHADLRSEETALSRVCVHASRRAVLARGCALRLVRLCRRHPAFVSAAVERGTARMRRYENRASDFNRRPHTSAGGCAFRPPPRGGAAGGERNATAVGDAQASNEGTAQFTSVAPASA
jgi:hypothetical protein